MNKIPRVVCVEPHSLINENNLGRFGEVVYLFDDMNIRPSIWTEKYEDATLSRLDEIDYNPAKDFIVITAHMVPLIKVVAVICSEWGYLRGLFFHAKRDTYTIMRVGER